ncbi:MAG: 2OG-Fe(II) oxygenase [Deltaproteobacteria bacterium]|nr:2OG-Fe(II) oxygenase [Deltaproteobacteria bacterium]
MPDFDRRRPIDETIWGIDGVFDRETCESFITRFESQGFERAPITTASGPVMNDRVRNNERLMFDDPAMAQSLFERVKSALPEHIDAWKVCGLNERFRVYRYDVGQRFRPHFDGCFMREYDREESALTLMVYLNDGFEGGETAFLDYGVVVKPKQGNVLVFFHPILHEGRSVLSGRKYVLRTDVMYRRE